MFARLRRALGLSEKQAGETFARPGLSNGQTDRSSILARSKDLLEEGNRFLDRGQLQEAAKCYRDAIECDPSGAAGHVNLGFVLKELGLPEEAAKHLQLALACDPAQVDALFLLGLKAQAEGDLARAETLLRRCHENHPSFELAVAPLCNVLLSQGDIKQAVAVVRQALGIHNKSPDLHSLLAKMLCAQGLLPEALEHYNHALRLNPSDANAWYQRGLVLNGLQRREEAAQSIEQSLQFKPDSAAAHNDLGSILTLLNQFEGALAHLDRALDIRPDFAEALATRAEVLRIQCRFEEATQVYQQLLSVAPRHDLAQGALLWSRINVCDWADYDQQVVQLCDAVDQGQYVTLPWSFLSMSDSPPLQLKCARLFGERRYPGANAPTPHQPSAGHSKIRVAYLSADFYNHATSHLIAELIEKHDPQKFSTLGISFGPDEKDEMRGRLARSFQEFVDVGGRSDIEIDALLRAREIDIAVDLKGYTAYARPRILALRPAPIQVSYLGYPGTMGVDYIDYILADHCLIPPAEQGHYSEKVAYLPDSYQVNDAKRRIADETPTRAEVGLPDGQFVFCGFNNLFKITPRMFDLWMEILREVEGSVLWLFGDNAAAVNNLRKEALARGVSPDRLVFAPRWIHAEHLARHRLADLFLDTLPCNAHTTASDALWVGLPVLTCAGSTFAGRVATSLLNAVGLQELVTTDLAEYRAKAIWLARNPAELNSIRSKLHERRSTSPLFDSSRFTAHLEAAYATMVQRWRQGLAPESFSVPPEPSQD